MEQLLSNNRQKLQAAIPLINNYNDRFDDLNHWWGKISLIGKINSHNVSDSILEEMLSTKEKFSELQGRLIQNLMKEHLLKRLADDHNKSQVAIDILIRNLFERTADVGFLATDDDIRAFLLHTDKQPEDIENIRHRLAEYVKKYSVYDEIVLLDTQGRVKANLDIDSPIEFSEDPLIPITLASTDDYTETFRYSDLQPHKRNSLIYSCVIKESNEKDAKALGVLCLCFKFDDEMQSIFSNLQSERAASSIMIVSESREVMATSHSQKFKVSEKIPNSGSPDLITIKNKSYISTTSKTKGYQGFKGLSWQGVAMTPLNDAFKHSNETGKPQTDSCQLLNSQLFSDDLKQIFKTSMLINDDLSLVVLNGIIAAARNNAVEFMPVLSEIKSTGESIALIFSDSIDNLQSTVISARLGDVRFCASLAVDIMDRNLYERANDCRWWALTTVFRQYLQLPTVGPDAQQEISNILGYINDLYTVYTNLYVYDKNGIIVAVSNKDHASVIGDKVDTQSGAIDALSCTDSQKYSVSKFVPSTQYDNKHTYIYNASITSVKGVQLFKVTEGVRCAPAVYEPTVVAIVSGTKEAILDGKSYVYGTDQYMCCSMSMPVEAGTPNASPDNPLLGVFISLDTRVMTELTMEVERACGMQKQSKGAKFPPSIALSDWDNDFAESLMRLLQLSQNGADTAVLGDSRLREVYYTILKGGAGESARRAFGVGNEIARAIDYLSTRLNETVTIEDMASQVGMSRAVFHRKFKQATSMSPIQFVKSMRLNTAAMKIVGGMTVNEAAMDVGYVSTSQFSREFKRLYGQSPKQWSQYRQIPAALI